MDEKGPLAGTRPQGMGVAPPVARPMEVPRGLKQRTRFEPSGCAWLGDIGRALVVSDDTGVRGDESDHAPWVFLLDRDGKVHGQPLVVQGVERLNDLEAVASDGGSTLYLVSSQSQSKKGRRPRERRLVIRVERKGETLVAVAQRELLDAIVSSYDQEQLAALGLRAHDVDWARELDIEAAAFVGGALLLGLKSPQSADGAILWRLDGLDEFFAGKRLRRGQLRRVATVDLGAGAGFSGLAKLSRDTFLALSTVAHPSETLPQRGRVYFLRLGRGGEVQAKLLYEYEGLKPEGVCPMPDNKALIVFDQGARAPLFAIIKVP